MPVFAVGRDARFAMPLHCAFTLASLDALGVAVAVV
jgi:hypothetical protein